MTYRGIYEFLLSIQASVSTFSIRALDPRVPRVFLVTCLSFANSTLASHQRGKPYFPPIPAEDPKVSSKFEQPNASDPDPEPNYLLLIHLEGTYSPTIQRTLSVPGSFTFAQLHDVIQAAFG